MTVLPVVDRELRAAARRPATYRLRQRAALCCALNAAWLIFASGAMGAPNNSGASLFATLKLLAFCFCVSAGVFGTADCLAEEKREGTLGLLFLTDLKTYDIVLGKLVSRALSWTFGLLAGFPILAMSLMLGGVPAGEFWLTLVALINLLCFSQAVGICVSAISRNERRAAFWTAIALLALLYWPYELADVVANRWHWAAGGWLLDHLNPVYAFESVALTVFRGQYADFWSALILSQLASWCLLALACVLLKRHWQDNPEGRAAPVRRERWKRWSFGSSAAWTSRRAKLMAINPFYWLANRSQNRPLFLLTAVCGMEVWFFLTVLIDSKSWTFLSLLPAVFIIHLLVKIVAAWEACHRFSEDRRNGTLELILSTPLTVGNILHGQWLAYRRQFTMLLLVIVGGDTIGFMAILAEVSQPVKPIEVILTGLAAVVVLYLDLITLCWMGLWTGLSAKTSLKAFGTTVAAVLAFPWILTNLAYVGLIRVLLIFSSGSGVIIAGTFAWFLGIWFLSAVLVDLALIYWSKGRLRRDFRLKAAERFQPKTVKPWWKPRFELIGD